MINDEIDGVRLAKMRRVKTDGIRPAKINKIKSDHPR